MCDIISIERYRPKNMLEIYPNFLESKTRTSSDRDYDMDYFNRIKYFTEINSKKDKNSIDNIKDMVYNKNVVEGNIKNKNLEVITMKNTNIISKVKGFSKTRQANENLTVRLKDTYAEVRSASGNKYVVTRESCTCKDHFFRGHDQVNEHGQIVKKGTVCRHRNAVINTIEKMRESSKYW